MIKIKPLSTNAAWQGRRFKTREYIAYEKELFTLLPKQIKIPDGKLEINYVFGLSNKNTDYDNYIKQFQDVLTKKYQFNDNKIYKALINKVDVKKGREFISFRIQKLL